MWFNHSNADWFLVNSMNISNGNMLDVDFENIKLDVSNHFQKHYNSHMTNGVEKKALASYSYEHQLHTVKHTHDHRKIHTVRFLYVVTKTRQHPCSADISETQNKQ